MQVTCATIRDVLAWAHQTGALLELAQSTLEVANTPKSHNIGAIIDIQAQLVWDQAYAEVFNDTGAPTPMTETRQTVVRKLAEIKLAIDALASYRKHFGKNSCAAAESDWIGRAIACLRFYADPNNTVRECMAGGPCANVDNCKTAAALLREVEGTSNGD